MCVSGPRRTMTSVDEPYAFQSEELEHVPVEIARFTVTATVDRLLSGNLDPRSCTGRARTSRPPPATFVVATVQSAATDNLLELARGGGLPSADEAQDPVLPGNPGTRTHSDRTCRRDCRSSVSRARSPGLVADRRR